MSMDNLTNFQVPSSIANNVATYVFGGKPYLRSYVRIWNSWHKSCSVKNVILANSTHVQFSKYCMQYSLLTPGGTSHLWAKSIPPYKSTFVIRDEKIGFMV